MTHASLFSGIGGFDLAARWAGWTNLFHCEIDPFCQTILKYHFQNATQYTDIRATDFTPWRGRVNILSGGFPCQPFSVAGKRQGTEDDRYLWPEMLRAIREIEPEWIVGENVRGIINWSGGMVFEQVCTDLEAAGYEVLPLLLPACGIGAPHRRDRVWFVAQNTECVRWNGNQSEEEPNTWQFGELGARDNVRVHGAQGFVAHCADAGGEAMRERQDGICGFGVTANGEGFGRNTRGADSHRQEYSQTEWTGIFELNNGPCEIGVNSDPTGNGQQKRNAVGASSERSEITGFDRFPTQSPVCGRDDGLPGKLDGITFPRWRAESIKAFGNAIVPQVALQIFNAINDLNNDN